MTLVPTFPVPPRTTTFTRLVYPERAELTPLVSDREHGQTCRLCGRRGSPLRLERQLEDLADRHHRVEGHLLADLFGHVVQVAAVSLGDDHVGQARRREPPAPSA